MKRVPLKRKSSIKRKRATKLDARSVISKKLLGKKRPTISNLRKKLWELTKQAVRNKYRREDGTYICYTCDKIITNPMDAHTSHFIASSICGTDLRYDMCNLRITDIRCNIHLGGNGAEFYRRMVKEIGQEAVDKIFERKNRNIIKADTFWYLQKIEEYEKLIAGNMETSSRS